MQLTKAKIQQLLAVFLIYAIGMVVFFGMLPSYIDSVAGARYIPYSDATTITPAVANVTTLTHGNIRNDSAYITVVLNTTTITQAGAINYTVSALGSYSTGANITFEGLTSGSVYIGTIDYSYLLPAAEDSAIAVITLLLLVIPVVATAVLLVALLKITDTGEGRSRSISFKRR